MSGKPMTLYERARVRCAVCGRLDHVYVQGTYSLADDCRVVTYFDHNAGALDGTKHCNELREEHCVCATREPSR